MSQQQLTVKVFLKGGCQRKRLLEQTDEIRRFGIDLDVATSYEYLLAKITSVFPGLVNKSLTLCWKDADGDMIAFSSDDELMEAIKCVSDGIFRVFVIEKKTQKSESQSCPDQASIFHPGVTCDGCNGGIRGIRYKCTVCPDYDLCNQCKSTGLHSEHEMRSIDRPQWPFCSFGMSFPGGPMGNSAPPMPPFHGQMPPHPPFPGQMPPHPPFPGQMPPYPPCAGQMPPPPAYGCFPPPPPPSAEPGVQEPETVDMRRLNRKAWKRWFKETYGHDHKRKHKKERKEKKEKKEGRKSSSSSSSDTEAESSPTGEYLQNIGHSVAAMLDPLGIDVEVDVEHHGQRRRCHRGSMGPWGCRGRGPFGPWGMRGRGDWGCHWKRNQFGCPPEWSAAAASAQSSGSNQQNTSDQNVPAAGPADRNQQCTTNSETGEMASGNLSRSPDHDWTVLDNGTSVADVEAATDGVREMNVTDDASHSHQTPPDQVIAHALESMMSMGYGNEGGWLTNLLVHYKGDIGRVLDAIHAKKT